MRHLAPSGRTWAKKLKRVGDPGSAGCPTVRDRVGLLRSMHASSWRGTISFVPVVGLGVAHIVTLAVVLLTPHHTACWLRVQVCASVINMATYNCSPARWAGRMGSQWLTLACNQGSRSRSLRCCTLRRTRRRQSTSVGTPETGHPTSSLPCRLFRATDSGHRIQNSAYCKVGRTDRRQRTLRRHCSDRDSNNRTSSRKCLSVAPHSHSCSPHRCLRANCSVPTTGWGARWQLGTGYRVCQSRRRPLVPVL